MRIHTCCKLNAWGLIILAVAAFALGVANLTVQCTSSMGPCSANGQNQRLFSTATFVFFIAVGIWTSVPCLLAGVGLLRKLKKPDYTMDWLWMLLVISTFFFTPLLVIFSAFNTINSMSVMSPSPTTQETVAFAVPLSAAIVGGILHLKLLVSYCYFAREMRTQKTITEVIVASSAVQPPAGIRAGHLIVEPGAAPSATNANWYAPRVTSSHCACNSAYGVQHFGR